VNGREKQTNNNKKKKKIGGLCFEEFLGVMVMYYKHPQGQ
jgi:hypothetical protein